MKEKIDLRVTKTKKALVTAMIEGLHKKPFEEITVQYLCDLAVVRRATFYSHFADKYQLFSYTIRCIYQELPSLQQAKSTQHTEDIYANMVEDAINFLSDNTAVFKSVMNSQLTHMILNIVRSELETELVPIIATDFARNGQHTRSPQLLFDFYLHGIFGAFLWWVREGRPISKEDLIAQVQETLQCSEHQ